MGVKYLWTILAPFCDRKPLYELQGKTVAVDLSCWICEAQNVADYQVQPRMYLRNLYFRTCYLLLMDVNPVFVLEGKAPELKYDTMLARNAIRFKGAKPKTDKVKTGKDRNRFNFILRQCEEMLASMGLACIKGTGEAESLCANLNEDGLVDGCISQDSDCFAYGAQVVYRNFSISTQGTQAASGGAVDVYDITKVNRSLSFGRHKIVAMALLIGCDYSDGVYGVGKDSVLKFFETVSDDEVLDKLRSWQKNKYVYEQYEKRLSDKNICTSCGHSGKIQAHTKNGCATCKTTAHCDPFKYKNERLNMKNELNMRNKAIKDPNFPDECLIKEFLDRKDNVSELDLKWKQPDVVKFLKFTAKFLQWDELYAFERILPILTRWQCKNSNLLKNETNYLKGAVEPVKIKKVRNPKGVSSYEIIWSDPGECFTGLIPEKQILENNIDVEKLWSTIEPQNLVENAYPQLVEDFKQSKVKPKKRMRKKDNNIDEIRETLGSMSISEPKSKRGRKPRSDATLQTVATAMGRLKKNETDFCVDDLDSSLKQLTIKKSNTKIQKPVSGDVDSLNSSFKQMVIKKQKKNAPKAAARTLDSFVTSIKQHPNNKKYSDNLKIITSSTPAKTAKTDKSFDLDVSSFGDESDLEVSEIVGDIVSREDVKDGLKFVAETYVQSLEKNIDRLIAGSVEDGSGPEEELYKEDFDQLESDGGDHDDGSCNTFNDNVDQVSSFFSHHLGAKNDLFEKTINETFHNLEQSSGSDTEEYEYEIDDVINKNDEKENLKEIGKSSIQNGRKMEDGDNILLSSDEEDSFVIDNYVPLYERLKNN